ncbi:hypothetical protein BH11PLA2_BH11PLA2_48040 [soil metagenome]
MNTDTLAISNFDHLSEYVQKELCERDALDKATTPFVKTKVLRGGQPWGYVFHVEGPRMLRTSAVWSMADDAIVFYNSTGTRVKEVRLSESPNMDLPLAKAA